MEANRIPPLEPETQQDPATGTRSPNRDPAKEPDGGASGGELSSGSPPDQPKATLSGVLWQVPPTRTLTSRLVARLPVVGLVIVMRTS